MTDDTTIEYEPVTALGAAYAKVLFEIWEKLGRPDDLTTTTGWRLLDEIIKVWEGAFPQEVLDWKHDRDIDLLAERTIQEHVKAGGYNPVSYPPTLFHLIKVLLPKLKLTDKRVHHSICQRYPKLFQTTNYAV